MATLKIDPEKTKNIIVEFISDEVKKAGLKGGVIGLSGGLDSAVVLYLTVEALGEKNVLALILPYKESSPENIRDAEELAKIKKVKAVKLDITPLVEPYFSVRKGIDNLRKGNYLARTRMAIIYDFSKELDYMVIGTSNKSERLLGYFTLWGDMACGIAPIGDIYKTQVRELAKHIGVPDKIIKKVPSADLWKGQADEKEIGAKYERIDMIFHMFYDLKWGKDWIVAENFSEEEIELVFNRFRSSEYKRRMPIFPIITSRD